MRCRDAREWLCAQRDGDLANVEAFEEHIEVCTSCQAFARQMRRLKSLKCDTPEPEQSQLSTDRIMQAIQQQKRISQQLEDIREQQKTRVQGLRTVGAACVALGVFTLSSLPLLILAAIIIQMDMALKGLYLLNGVIDTTIILFQYLEAELGLVTRNNWLLSGLAFVVVVMTGMWLRLMRLPREA